LEKPARNLAIDTYRGFVMLLMMAEVVQLSRVAKALPGNGFWNFLAYHQTHVEWAGCSLHDTIQPGFSFLVGVALPYSIAARIAKGGTFGSMFLHALWRSLLLIALGVFLRSTHAPQTYYTFEDTLSQIGLGYPLLFLLAGVGALSRAAGRILLGLRGALEQRKQLWQRVRRLVPQSVSDRETVRRQQRRIPYPQLHTDAGHDDPRTGRGTVAARRISIGADAAIAGGRRDWHCRGPVVALHWHLSRGETHLDARVDALQRRPLLSFPGGLLLVDGGEGVSQMGLPASGDRGELDCGVPDGAPVGALHPGFLPHSSRRACLRLCGNGG
jgi:hypothetical protein